MTKVKYEVENFSEDEVNEIIDSFFSSIKEEKRGKRVTLKIKKEHYQVFKEFNKPFKKIFTKFVEEIINIYKEKIVKNQEDENNITKENIINNMKDIVKIMKENDSQKTIVNDSIYIMKTDKMNKNSNSNSNNNNNNNSNSNSNNNNNNNNNNNSNNNNNNNNSNNNNNNNNNSNNNNNNNSNNNNNNNNNSNNNNNNSNSNNEYCYLIEFSYGSSRSDSNPLSRLQKNNCNTSIKIKNDLTFESDKNYIMVYNENNKYYLSKITTFLSDKQYIQGIGSKMKITSKNNNNNSKVKNNTRRTYLEKLLHNNITVFIEVMCFFLKNSKELKDEITYSSDLIEVNDEDLKKLISNDNTKLDIEGLKKILKYIESKKKENDIESKKKRK